MTHHPGHFLRWRVGAVAVGLAGSCMLTACSSSSSPSGSPSASPTPASTAPAAMATAATGLPGQNASVGAVTPTSRAPSSAVPTVSHPPALTTEVPAPGGGNVSQTVAPQTPKTAPSVPITATASFGGKVTAAITKVAMVKASAKGPGEIAGAAIAITVSIHNGSAKAVDLSGLVVNVADKSGAPQIPTSSDPSDPISGSAAAGSDVKGVYVFTIQNTIKNPVSISVSYSTEAPVVLFVGDAK